MTNSRQAFLVLVLITISLGAYASSFRISGFVKDSVSGERLIGANIVEHQTQNGTAADHNGYFSLITHCNNIEISFIGYKSKTITFSSDTLLHIALEAGELIDEVSVKGERANRFNIATLSTIELNKIPMIGGKPDVMKALQLMPGIQSQAEGTSLINVRGGNPGENLYLIDNVPLIYVNHLGGFMSVFNPDMMNNIEVYKGGFPARYGGKLSSIMAISQREGDKSGLKGALSIGITDVSFSVEGPLVGKKTSFIVTGRKTLTEPLFLATCLLTDQDNNIAYGFHDLNGKFSWQPNTKNSFYVNVFQGDDYIHFSNRDWKELKEKRKHLTIWGNWLVAGRWCRVINTRLFVDNALSLTRYRLSVNNTFNTVGDTNSTMFFNNYRASVSDLSLRSNWQYKATNNWNLDFGTKLTNYQHIPSRIFNSDKSKVSIHETIGSWEGALYLDNKIKLFEKVEADAGLRMVYYLSEKFNKFLLEPRVNINYWINKNHLFNITYQQVNQFSHLIYTTGNIMNNEIWIPAEKNIPPAHSNQYSAGWKSKFINNKYDTELTVYYKELKQLATYKEGYANLMGDGGWRSKIETEGKGEAKGIELLLRKNKGNWTGFTAYTYSQTTRQYPGINKGNKYLFEFDRPHSFSVNVNRQISEKWSFYATWIYQTGTPYTPVIGRQITPVIEPEVNYTEEYLYGESNSERLKNYHRLDAGFTLKTNTHWGNKAIWNFSVYNLYNRHNVASYFYGYSEQGLVGYDSENYTPLKQYQISYFPMIPSISYKVFFEAKPKVENKNKKSIKQKIINYFNYEYK